jgi:hypothetical protein
MSYLVRIKCVIDRTDVPRNAIIHKKRQVPLQIPLTKDVSEQPSEIMRWSFVEDKPPDDACDSTSILSGGPVVRKEELAQSALVSHFIERKKLYLLYRRHEDFPLTRAYLIKRGSTAFRHADAQEVRSWHMPPLSLSVGGRGHADRTSSVALGTLGTDTTFLTEVEHLHRGDFTQ